MANLGMPAPSRDGEGGGDVKKLFRQGLAILRDELPRWARR